MTDLPDWYDDLDGTLDNALAELSAAVSDRGHGFRTFTLASIGPEGAPSARIVVLRAVDAPRRQLRFHTDLRSEKVDQLAKNDLVSMVFYDKARKLQLRVNGRAAVKSIAEGDGDDLAAQAFAASQPMSRECYRVEPGSGSIIDAPDGYSHAAVSDREDGDVLTDPGAEHFAAVVVTFDVIEVLYLAAEGHRRSRFEWSDGGAFQGVWLTP
ncbi:pyridoxamine 5'-phosphate oxidase family protein [Fulvimarina sp. MAC8]|uniref:pyridoxamine 5'-phosphate oxidase family protein n=1 Tax=Fulvimarina sp. MAC8 TaxID=3162874 RepID=UPI0032EE4BFC